MRRVHACPHAYTRARLLCKLLSPWAKCSNLTSFAARAFAPARTTWARSPPPTSCCPTTPSSPSAPTTPRACRAPTRSATSGAAWGPTTRWGRLRGGVVICRRSPRAAYGRVEPHPPAGYGPLRASHSAWVSTRHAGPLCALPPAPSCRMLAYPMLHLSSTECPPVRIPGVAQSHLSSRTSLPPSPPPPADLLQLPFLLPAFLHSRPGLLRGRHARQHLHMLHAHQAGNHGQRNAPAAPGGERRRPYSISTLQQTHCQPDCCVSLCCLRPGALQRPLPCAFPDLDQPVATISRGS